MDQKNRVSHATATGKNERAKKPYQKPGFRYEKVFETMALACGKVSITQKHCQFRRMTS